MGTVTSLDALIALAMKAVDNQEYEKAVLSQYPENVVLEVKGLDGKKIFTVPMTRKNSVDKGNVGYYSEKPRDEKGAVKALGSPWWKINISFTGTASPAHSLKESIPALVESMKKIYPKPASQSLADYEIKLLERVADNLGLS